MRIALDAMGGDLAPDQAVRGAVMAAEAFPDDEIMLVGAAVCVEIWTLAAWTTHLETEMPEFRKLLDQLIG